ncbi:MAG TPA: MHYT domain-containing protein [Streptosporangiaceae bacterium]|nr:MHYT domain-containing protein [Streptosporangiaceae bacterium]
MLTVHNFSAGLITPALGYLMSFIGAFLALRCTTRARVSTGRVRLGWLLSAGLSLGVTGIWVMHFIAMLGFSVPGHSIRYNVLITLGSMLLAVVFVTCGLLFVGFGKVTTWSLLGAGAVTGIGVAAMHYTGMEAMVSNFTMSYNPLLFVTSVVIAIVASTAALWAALRLNSVWSTFGAAAIMGVAVSGMHYTGMAAMHVFAGPEMTMSGASAVDFVLPLVVGVSALTFVMTATVALAPTHEEITQEADLMRRIDEVRAREPYSAPPPIVSGNQDRRTGKLAVFPPDTAPNDTVGELTLTE